MMRWTFTVALTLASFTVTQKEQHDHPAPEKLGTVAFPISCKPEMQPEFNRAIALLHSFAYKAADNAFQNIVELDSHCAIAHWGRAMTHYHQLWDLPPSPEDTALAELEIRQAAMLEGASEREFGFIHAISQLFKDGTTPPYSTRATKYEAAMHDLAVANPRDVETQVFYALSLVSNASPSDKKHRRQKLALGILEPLFHEFPDHPGIPHYVIHACDNQELASRGLAAARAYASIAPSAPHALHMPSHIFTRLGLWNDSIESNLGAISAAQHEGDTGEELHAMDYLVYAYLQSGRALDAANVIQQLKVKQNLRMGEFKTGYAATAMPIRYIVERRKWNEAEKIIDPPDTAQPSVVAIAVWARGLGFARTGHRLDAARETARLGEIEDRLRASGNSYWAIQVDIMRRELEAWSEQAANEPDKAAITLRGAADDEDGIEKLPVTPGPIVPAREQLGELLLEQGNPAAASKALATALTNTPGRRVALQMAAEATHSRPATKHSSKTN